MVKPESRAKPRVLKIETIGVAKGTRPAKAPPCYYHLQQQLLLPINVTMGGMDDNQTNKQSCYRIYTCLDFHHTATTFLLTFARGGAFYLSSHFELCQVSSEFLLHLTFKYLLERQNFVSYSVWNVFLRKSSFAPPLPVSHVFIKCIGDVVF